MTDELQQPSQQQGELEYSSSQTQSPASPHKKSNKIIWIIGIIAVVASICLCSVVCIIIASVSSMENMFQDNAPIENVLDLYMRFMEDKDAENAYALFSPQVQEQMPILKVQDTFEGNNYFLFEGYQRLSVRNFNFSSSLITTPGMSQRQIAKVNGVIDYEHDFQGTFNATLEKINDTWMIYSIFVTVPPDKIK